MNEIASEALEKLTRHNLPAAQPLVGYAPQWFTMIVHRAAAEAGFPPGRRNAHLLRSSFATHLLGKGVPISVVSKLLGHMRVSTTGRYLAVRGEDRRAAVDSLSLKVAIPSMARQY